MNIPKNLFKKWMTVLSHVLLHVCDNSSDNPLEPPPVQTLPSQLALERPENMLRFVELRTVRRKHLNLKSL